MMVRRNHMLLVVSAISLSLNFLFIHYFSSLNSMTLDGDDCSSSSLSKSVKENDGSSVNEIEKLIQMRITSDEQGGNELTIPRISSFVDHYIKQKLIFVLGSMSSGTTLTRLVLDTHPEINCGDETKIIELMLTFIEKTTTNEYFMRFMANAGTKNATIDKATALFIYYVLENNFKTKNITFLNKVNIFLIKRLFIFIL